MKKHYQKYCMHFAYVIISISTFLFTTQVFSQGKLKINPEFSKQIIEKYKVEPFEIFPVKIKETENKPIIYVMEDNHIDIDLLSGDFIKLPDNYMLTTKEIPNRFVKNQLFTEKDEGYENLGGSFERFPILKKVSTNELFYFMSNRFVGQLEIEFERANFKNLGNTAEYKTWKTNYLTLLQSAQTNVNACNAIIKKHTYLNRLGQKRYDSTTFTKQEKVSFNQNLDSLNEKLKKIGDLEDERDFLNFYNNRVSNVEATKSYALSTFYNSTSIKVIK
ncbi:hypothetical protein [Flavobacterium denitrificans]|uniref:hypothetical protein n=1 Tax=Flavobacterium denitrificans TaxID=281361 RepID=UPI00047B05C5|nr:hypothetical protein [Flavobacterium denitrificans]